MKDQLQALQFPVTQQEGQGCEFADGTSGVICTNFAKQVQKLFPGRTKIVGFFTDDNPVDHYEIQNHGGHDFAIVDGRYIVDHWLRDVIGETGRTVFDLEDAADADAIQHRYGDRSKWTEWKKI